MVCSEIDSKLKVSKILVNNSFKIKNIIKDYKNNVRCVIAILIK